MLSEEQIELISESLRPLFQQLEQDVIKEIAERIMHTMQYTRTAQLRAEALQRLGFSPNKIRTEAMKLLMSDEAYKKAVEENTAAFKKSIKLLLRELCMSAKKETQELFEQAVKESWEDDISFWEQGGQKLSDDSFLHELNEAIYKQTAGALENLTRTTTIGFHTMNGYESLPNAYIKELDKALIRITTGTYSGSEVVREIIHNLADSGIRSIDFESKRSMELDTAVKLAVRTGAAQISGQMHTENVLRGEINLVEVSSHWGARNKGTGCENHEAWQGKVYYIKSGENYEDEAKRIGQATITDIWEATGFSPDGSHPNDPRGLYGYNCRHRLYAWFEGVSKKHPVPEQPAGKTINGKYYDYYAMTQEMRRRERQIRRLKKERNALKAVGEPVEALNSQIRQKTEAYREFCDQCGIKPKTANLRYEPDSDIKKGKAYQALQGSLKLAEKLEGEKQEHSEEDIIKTKLQEEEAADIIKTIRLGTISDNISDTQKEALSDLLKKAPENIISSWENCSLQIAIINPDYNGGSQYSYISEGIFIDMSKAASDTFADVGKGNELYRSAYNELFHECGHAIDNIAGKNIIGGISTNFYSTVFISKRHNTTLGSMLGQEVTEAINAYGAEQMTNMLLDMKLAESADISDIFGAFTQNTVVGWTGHDVDYWTKDAYGLAGREAFAEMYAAEITAPESLKMFKKYFPKSYEIFQEMLRGIAEIEMKEAKQ